MGWKRWRDNLFWCYLKCKCGASYFQLYILSSILNPPTYCFFSSPLFFVCPGVFSLCSSSLRCWGPKHPSPDYPWSLSRLLFAILEKVQFYYPSSVWWPTHSQNQRRPDSTLPLPGARWHRLLLPTSPQQPNAHKELRPGSVWFRWLSSAMCRRSGQWSAKPTSHGPCKWWHTSVLCCGTGGLGVDLPFWLVQTGETIFKYY